MHRIRSSPFRVLRWTVLLVAVLSTGCSVSVCDDANKVCEGDELEGADECDAAAECVANCIIEWDSCHLDDPASDEAQCAAECAPTEEG